jgi:hypothetical protein
VEFAGNWRVPALLTLILLVCYSPALLTHYGFCDDYAYLGEGVQGGTVMQKLSIGVGRPTFAGLLYVAFHSLGTIDNLVYLRLFGAFGLAVLAYLLYLSLRWAGWNQSQSFCLSLIIASMPAFQVYVGWATTAFCTWTCALAGCAWWMGQRACTQKSWKRTWSFRIFAVLMLVVALTIHQSAAMIFWGFVAISVFRPDTTPARAVRELAWHGFIGFAALAIGFVIFKVGMAIYGSLMGAVERTGLSLDPIGKLRWFVTEPLVNALGFADIFPGRRLAVLVALLIGGGLLCYFRGPMRQRLQLALMAAALIPLSYLPNLLITENFASYRTISGLTTVCVVYAFLALQGYCRVMPWCHASRLPVTVLTCLSVACLLLATLQVHAYFARPQAAELQWVRQQIRKSDLIHTSGVYLIRPRGRLWYEKRYDEFGLPSTCQKWVPIPMVFLVLSEIDPSLAKLPVEHFGSDCQIDPPPSTVVVDMRDMPFRN